MDGKTLFMFSTFGNGIFQKTKYLKKLFSFFGFLQKSYHCNTSCINLVFAKMLHFYKLSTVFVRLKSSNVHFRFHPVHVDDYPVHFLDYSQNISQQLHRNKMITKTRKIFPSKNLSTRTFSQHHASNTR